LAVSIAAFVAELAPVMMRKLKKWFKMFLMVYTVVNVP
jgi:hypothetical protein